MRKFYSFVLMAMMLLIGTNMWATIHQVSAFDGDNGLEAAWKNAASGDIIQLTGPVTATKILWLGTDDLNGTIGLRSLTLDLNGNVLKDNHDVAAEGLQNMFVISHGELNVISSVPGGQIIANEYQTCNNGTAYKTQEVFRVSGSDNTWSGNPKLTPDSASWTSGTKWSDVYYSHLTIGEGVTVNAKYGDAIVVDYIDNFWPDMTNVVAANDVTKFNSYDATQGIYAFRGSSYQYVAPYQFIINPAVSYANTNNHYKLATGVRVDVYGKIRSEKYSMKVNGWCQKPSDIDHAPFLHIHSTGDVYSTKSAAVYSSGYGRWLIEGKCEGSTGVYVKGGQVDIHDATIASNSTTYAAPNNDTGASGKGSAITIHSTTNTDYAGFIEVTISGDTKATSDAGYAVEESITKYDYQGEGDAKTKVTSVDIEGGTFEGGDLGSIIITNTTVDDATVTISGGQVSTEGSIGGQTIAQYVTGGSDAHVTLVGNTVVISKGAAPTEYDHVQGNAKDSVKWVGAGANATETLSANLTLKELEINQTWEQTLTIPANKTLTVGHLIMGANAQIIVEAGAKLIVTGEQGIIAPVTSNIVLSTSNAAQAVLLFNPAVSSNRHPNATVEMIAKDLGYMQLGGSYYWNWHRFALPIKKATSWQKTPNVPSYVYGWNYTTNSWEQYTSLEQMVPFQGHTMTADQGGDMVYSDVTYTFKGELAGGNDNNDLQFVRSGFHFFGNSYTANISIAKLVAQLMADEKIDGSIWVWNAANQSYVTVPLMSLNQYPDFDEIAPMQTFILKQIGEGTNSTELNYASAVWGNPSYNSFTGNSAPRRRIEVADESTRMRIVVTAENGKSDFVMLTEDAQFSDVFEKGYDGAKYMNENALNMYAPVNGENYSAVATDNLEGKTLTINTVNNVNYTMSFANVNGEEYAVRDNATGAVFAIKEGASYEFAAQPNSVVEGRFEIVPVAKVPTAIDNTEAKANVKGIYTIMGQYVGEDFDVLPAGIYVVNGVKIVK